MSKKNRQPFVDPALQAQWQSALALLQQGRPAEAERICTEILQRAPKHFAALNLLGMIACQTGSPEKAVPLFSKAVAVNPDSPQAQYNRGIALQALARFQDALVSYNKAIALRANYAEAYSNRGIVLHALGRLQDALLSCDKAIALRPDFAQAQYNRGNVLNALGRFEEALAGYDKAVALAGAGAGRDPGFAEVHFHRGNALNALKRPDDALASYDRAIALKPDYAAAYSNRGLALAALRRLDEALASFDQAIALKPDDAEAHFNRGIVLKELGRLEEALAAIKQAGALEPDLDDGTAFHVQMNLCDWADLPAGFAALERKISAGASLGPFALLAFSDAPALQRKAAQNYAEATYPKDDRLGAIRKYPPHGRIRIGYFCADFRDHPTSRLLCGVFERHDKNKFETFAFSFGRRRDFMTERLRAAFDRFLDVENVSDEKIAALARENEIDIAVDLMGFITDARPGIFALRAAPVQVSYLAYPATMGAGYIDYLIADETIVPNRHQPFYAEKIVALPHSYQANSYRDEPSLPATALTRAEAGLPEGKFVFCCFNNSYKITPGVFDYWMRILERVEGSVLWLLPDNPAAAANLRKEAAARGVDPARLVFAPRLPMREHLARHRLADLFLDTLPYNAHTTASDALWMGVPVLTRMGETFAARVAASLLNAIDLPELVTASPDAYAALAVELASDRERLSRLKERLARNRLSAPLFDTERFTRDLEAAYAAMVARGREGLAAERIYVAGQEALGYSPTPRGVI